MNSGLSSDFRCQKMFSKTSSSFKNSFVNLKIHIRNGCTPEPSAKKRRLETVSPDQGCCMAFSPLEKETKGKGPRRFSMESFDKDIDSFFCLENKKDEGYVSSLSCEAQDADSLVEALDDSKIGSPLFESSVCGDVDEPSFESGWETTLPLQVKVKSVVVAPNKPLPLEGARRPYNGRDWDREKRRYIESVTWHIKESGSTPDTMDELQKLMMQVADDTQTTNGQQWQHPSDLTRRNYQKRFKTDRKLSLQEWKVKNHPTKKQFAKVPKIFVRSLFS